MKDVSHSRRTRFALARTLICASTAAITLGVVGAAAVGASSVPNHHRFMGGRPAAAGTVASTPSADSFTITTRSGSTLTVSVTTSTTYAERGATSPTLNDVAKGDLVAIFGTTSGTAVSATQVVIFIPRTSIGTPAAAGTVASTPSADSFTITTRSGSTLTIDVTSSTTYMERGVTSASLSDVAKGDRVAVFGTTSGSTVTATEVVIAPPRPNGTFATAGTVASAPSANSFTVTTWNGTTVTVDVTTSTTYMARSLTSASLSDVAKGDRVAVFGTTSGSTVTATEVVIAPPRPNGTFATAGTVASAPSANSFTVTTWNGTTVTVDVTTSTTYAELGVMSATLTNVAKGDFVAVFGTTSGSTVSATEVLIAGNPSAGMFGFGVPFHLRHGGRGFGAYGGFGFGRGFGRIQQSI